jgi:hypothetical protein
MGRDTYHPPTYFACYSNLLRLAVLDTNIIPDKTTSKILIARVAPGIARFALSLPEAGVHLPDQKHTRNIFERF